ELVLAGEAARVGELEPPRFVFGRVADVRQRIVEARRLVDVAAEQTRHVGVWLVVRRRRNGALRAAEVRLDDRSGHAQVDAWVGVFDATLPPGGTDAAAARCATARCATAARRAGARPTQRARRGARAACRAARAVVERV